MARGLTPFEGGQAWFPRYLAAGEVSSETLAILHARRAGNRGKRMRVTTTDAPVAVADAVPQSKEPAPAFSSRLWAVSPAGMSPLKMAG